MNGEMKVLVQEYIDIAELQKSINDLFHEKLNRLEEAKIRLMKENKAEPIKMSEDEMAADIIGDNK